MNQDFSMKEALDITLEKEFGCALTIVGPLLDSYLKAFGKGMLNKLSRSHHTGFAETIEFIFTMANVLFFCKIGNWVWS